MQAKATAAAAVWPWLVGDIFIRFVVFIPLLAGHQLVQVPSVDHSIDAQVFVRGVLYRRRRTRRVLSGHHRSSNRYS